MTICKGQYDTFQVSPSFLQSSCHHSDLVSSPGPPELRMLQGRAKLSSPCTAQLQAILQIPYSLPSPWVHAHQACTHIPVLSNGCLREGVLRVASGPDSATSTIQGCNMRCLQETAARN